MIYFIQAGQNVKIGFSRSVKERVKEIHREVKAEVCLLG
jgi:hypothetical protein